ncbi:hypothetical protein KSF_066480 [Reticulibacter mediterranei]|uniref:Uncharacterized protein n=1 Tax=Reticulibacter mediterranei TaxID=2778369 RepID=A0A8J3ITG0_9CHLR|nr:hypothetical protein KSF_066480 [Reticulibacter mediterranei]
MAKKVSAMREDTLNDLATVKQELRSLKRAINTFVSGEGDRNANR